MKAYNEFFYFSLQSNVLIIKFKIKITYFLSIHSVVKFYLSVEIELKLLFIYFFFEESSVSEFILMN